MTTLETNGYTISSENVPANVVLNGAGGNTPAMFTVPYIFHAQAEMQSYSVIYAENVDPLVSSDQTLTIACGITDLEKVFKYSVAAVGTLTAPSRLVFNPALMGVTISGWATVSTILDDAGATVTTPYGVIQSLLAGGGAGDTLPNNLNCIQNIVNEGMKIDDVFAKTLIDVTCTLTDGSGSPIWCNTMGLPGIALDLSRGQAVFGLFEQLAGNGRISKTDKTSMQPPDYYLGDGLQFYLDYTVNVNIGYQWSTDFADSNFNTIEPAEFALSDFCQADFAAPGGVTFWVNDVSYSLKNTAATSNVMYKVNIVSVSTS
jgi:hypothetical protein